MGQFYKYTEKRTPTMLRLLLIVLVILPGVTFSNDQLTGVWESENEDLRLDILDGFKPNRGAILAIENGVETTVGFWETKEFDTSMRIGLEVGVGKIPRGRIPLNGSTKSSRNARESLKMMSPF